MSHSDKIRSIHSIDNLGLSEKRKLVYEIKGSAFNTIKDKVRNQPWTDDDLTVNITSLEVDDLHRLIVFCEAWRNGVQLTLDLPFIYVNPPLKISPGDNESPELVLQRIVTDTVKRF